MRRRIDWLGLQIAVLVGHALIGCSCPTIPSWALEIVVRDTSGNPLTDAAVTCSTAGTRETPIVASGGAYQCGNVPGEYEVSVARHGHAVVQAVVVVAEGRERCGGLQTVQLTFTLDADDADAGEAGTPPDAGSALDAAHPDTAP